MRSLPLAYLPLALALGLGCQSSRLPCAQSDGGCLPVTGSYYVVFDPAIQCYQWEQQIPSSSVMQATLSGSNLTLSLWPNTASTHSLTGTLYDDGTIFVTESQLNVTIGLPYATVSGRFQGQGDGGANTPPFYLTGQLVLQGGAGEQAGTPPPGGAVNSCATAVSVSAQQQTSQVIDLDGGALPTDGGIDAGI